MGYKTEKIGLAVQALKDYHTGAAQLLAELDEAKTRYSPEVFRQKQAEVQEKFSALYASAKSSVDEAIKDIRRRGESARLAALTIGEAEEDCRLLSLPVDLSPDELRLMVKRNEGNVLFGRAVAKYAREHGYDQKDLTSLAAQRSAFEQYTESANYLQTILGKCISSDSLDQMRGGNQAKFLEEIDAAGILSEG